MDQRANIAAYLAGRLAPEEIRAFERACAEDPQLAREVEDLRGTAAWIDDFAVQASRPEYRLSAERRARILAEARNDIVAFPAAATKARPGRRRTFAPAYTVRRAVSALAAAAAIVLGGFVGLETGKQRVEAEMSGLHASLDSTISETSVEYPETIHYYPPAYGLDHADALRFDAAHGPGEYGLVNDYDLPAVGYALTAPPRYYGLPGPRPPYLSGSVTDTQP